MIIQLIVITYNDMNGTTAFASRGADMAFAKGIMVVISAGNSGSTSESTY